MLFVSDMVYSFVRQICGTNFTIEWVKTNYKNPTELLTYCNEVANRCHMALPVVSSTTLPKFNAIPVAPFYSIKGLAYVTLETERFRFTLHNMKSTVKKLLPLFAIAVGATFFSGFVIWLIVSLLFYLDFLFHIFYISFLVFLKIYDKTTLKVIAEPYLGPYSKSM